MKKYALLFVIFLLAACSGGGTGGAMAQTPSLMSPSDMSNQEAANKNNEGVDHLVQGHYDVSKPLFEQALAAKPNFAEAYFNLGVTLDGMGKHPEATEAFKKALEFGKDNPKISENALLKKHLSM
ncbi:MAG: tetratricopeptide repeat protein [Nitrospirae bacterium]|nr:tetratricopeptide repeat protein [Candidatus Troglogloeales bacterium]MBI3598462.1 tetratricopeptide repeat protein [Candidatus Troglogloeales bacterium]